MKNFAWERINEKINDNRMAYKCPKTLANKGLSGICVLLSYHIRTTTRYQYATNMLPSIYPVIFLRSVKELAEKEGITETLKPENQMLWVQRMNAVRETATEIVNNELIFN